MKHTLWRVPSTLRAGVALAAVGIAPATVPGGPARAATPANTRVIAKNIDDIISLDPAETFEISGGEVIDNLYTRLVTHDTADFTKLAGGVAESWSVGADGKTFTFTIRQGQKFQSGRPVTAKDAAFSLHRVVALNKTPDDRTLIVRTAEAFAPELPPERWTPGYAA